MPVLRPVRMARHFPGTVSPELIQAQTAIHSTKFHPVRLLRYEAWPEINMPCLICQYRACPGFVFRFRFPLFQRHLLRPQEKPIVLGRLQIQKIPTPPLLSADGDNRMARTPRSLQTAAVLVLIFSAAAIAYGQDGGKAIQVEPIGVPQSWALLVGVRTIFSAHHLFAQGTFSPKNRTSP